MHQQPQQEHQWLEKLVGEWTSEMEASMGPDQPPTKILGKESVRSLGGMWTLCEAQSTMPAGDTHRTIMTLGYDPAKGKYVGTFIGSMMHFMWVYEGTLDEASQTLTLDTMGPSFTGDNKLVPYQDIIEFKSPDHRVLRSQTPGPDGAWKQFMTMQYRRVK
jgi:hypothetical protein